MRPKPVMVGGVFGVVGVRGDVGEVGVVYPFSGSGVFKMSGSVCFEVLVAKVCSFSSESVFACWEGGYGARGWGFEN